MTGIKHYTLDENEEVPYEFVVTRNVNGEPEFCASFVNTNTLAYGNGVLLKFHQRNDELRAENTKLLKDLEFERSENGWVREFLDRMGQKCGTKDCPPLVAYVTKLEDENVKLRKLASDMWKAISTHKRINFAQLLRFGERMHELRIEVDEC